MREEANIPDGVAPSEPIAVALLGSSGIVAQRFIQRLAVHPWFNLCAVFGSPQRAGQQLEESDWHLPEKRPSGLNLRVLSSENTSMISQLKKLNVQLIFSALPNAEAEAIEPTLRKHGFWIFSNSSPHRMDRDVPLVIPEVNPEHLNILDARGSTHEGGIVCSTNCTVMPLAITLKALTPNRKVERITVNTEQSLSGGGVNLMMRANRDGSVEPEIPGEADKMVEELERLFGSELNSQIISSDLDVSISCKRVMRDFGHLLHVDVELAEPATVSQVEEWMHNFSAAPQYYDLPSAPRRPIQVSEMALAEARHAGSDATTENDSLQILRAGMAVVVSNLQVVGTTISYSVYSENTIRGAAGGCMLLAELAVAQKRPPLAQYF